MELVLVKLIISVFIIKKVSIITSFYGFMFIMFTLSVPPDIPTVSVIPVINGKQLSINLSIDVSST